MQVVPPQAAARVPVSKLSAVQSMPVQHCRWVCASMKPGNTQQPVTSLDDVGEPGSMCAAISAILSPSSARSARRRPSGVTSVPFVRILLIGFPLLTMGQKGTVPF